MGGMKYPGRSELSTEHPAFMSDGVGYTLCALSRQHSHELSGLAMVPPYHAHVFS